jgi:hypothetical protein
MLLEFKPMQLLKYATVITLFLLFSTGWAGENPAAQDKPRIYSSDTMKINALVESVDYATREVTLRDPGGELITFTAGEEVRNLEQMEVGDIIYVEYTQSYAIEVYGNSGYVPAASDFSDMGVAEIGDKPALSSIDTRVITATVEEINLEANTFKLRWPDDSVEGFIALNPENLNKAAVGDLVVITETIALDVSVEEVAVETE